VRLRLFVRRNGVRHVLSSMEHVYQSLVVPWALPRGVRYTTVIHDAQEHAGAEHVVRRWGRRAELRRADVVVTLSRSVTEDLVRGGLPAQRVRTLYHPAFGVPGPRPAARRLPEERPPVVGFFGRLLPYKGVVLLLLALKVLRSRGINVDARIVGDGPEARLRGTELGEHASWSVGWVEEQDVDAVVASFDVLALSYAEASQSGVVAHAVAHGVPVVATPVGGLLDQVGTAGGVVATAVQPEAFAAAVADLLDDPERYHLISRSMLASADELSWGRFVRGIPGLTPHEGSR
jgi:glycosyltransferase involved in cell wall biosynthesis